MIISHYKEVDEGNKEQVGGIKKKILGILKCFIYTQEQWKIIAKAKEKQYQIIAYHSFIIGKAYRNYMV